MIDTNAWTEASVVCNYDPEGGSGTLLPDHIIDWLETNVGESTGYRHSGEGQEWYVRGFQGQNLGQQRRYTLAFKHAHHALLFKLALAGNS